MLFGNRAPLWKYLFGLFALALTARFAVAAYLGAQAHLTTASVALLGMQVLSGLLVAIGLFRASRRPVLVGACGAGLTMVLSFAMGLADAAFGPVLPTGMLLALAVLSLALDRLDAAQARSADADPDAGTPGEDSRAGDSPGL